MGTRRSSRTRHPALQGGGVCEGRLQVQAGPETVFYCIPGKATWSWATVTSTPFPFPQPQRWQKEMQAARSHQNPAQNKLFIWLTHQRREKSNRENEERPSTKGGAAVFTFGASNCTESAGRRGHLSLRCGQVSSGSLLDGGFPRQRLPWAEIPRCRVTWTSLGVAVLVFGGVARTRQAPVAGLGVGACPLADAEAQLAVPGAGRPGAPGSPASAHCEWRGGSAAQEILHQG